MAEATLRVFRGDSERRKNHRLSRALAPGMVVLDALHYIQGYLAPDLAVRWNCKRGSVAPAPRKSTAVPADL